MAFEDQHAMVEVAVSIHAKGTLSHVLLGKARGKKELIVVTRQRFLRFQEYRSAMLSKLACVGFIRRGHNWQLLCLYDFTW